MSSTLVKRSGGLTVGRQVGGVEQATPTVATSGVATAIVTAV